MITYNDLATLLHAESDLNQKIDRLVRLRNSPLGKLPIVRSELHSRFIDLRYKRDRVTAAKDYANTILP